MLRKFFTLLGSVLLMLLLAVIVLPFLIPIDNYREDILKLVQEKTGREVTIDGALDFTLLPNIALEVNDVTIGNPSGFVSSQFAKIGTLRLKMALWPLLSKQVEVNHLAVDNAEIYLEEAVGGKKNWEFDTAKITKTSSNNLKKEQKSNFKMNVDSIFIENTKLHYLKPGQKFSTEDLNVDYKNNEAKVSLVLKHAGTNYKINVNTSDTKSLFSANQTPMILKMRSPLIRTDFEGNLERVNLSAGKFDAKLTGEIAGSFTGIGNLNSRKFTADVNKATMGILSIESDIGVSATGDMVVNYANKKPHLTTTLSIPELNLDALIPKEQPKKASFSFINNAYASTGWSRDTVNLGGLYTIDADAKLSVGTLISSGYTLSDFTSALKLNNGSLRVSNFKAGLLGGEVSGSGALNAKGTWNKTLKITNIPFEKLAVNYMEKVALTGMTNGSISLKSNGKSMHDWMHRLAGGGNLTIANGEIKGFSLPKLFRQIIGFNVPQTVASQVGEKTTFSAIKTAFSVDKGVMRLREGSLRGNRLKADASGTVSLAGQSLNLLLKPELIPQVEVIEGEEAPSGLMVPVMIKGSFDDIKVTPDYSSVIGNILKDPKNIEKKLKNFKTEGKAIEDSFEPTKDAINKNIKAFEDTKDPRKLLNILNELDKGGSNPLGGLLGGSR
ncbi:MAG: AsmA family protein [Rickettsiales bacterium]|nr:AsmA family protein [Rickettsiales bacterium]